MPTRSASPGTRYVVWYEGDDDRESMEFRSMSAARRFAARNSELHPIIDEIDKQGHLIRSYALS